MSPELQRLLEAYHEKRTSSPGDDVRCDLAFEELLAGAMARKPNVSRDQLLNAIVERYAEFRRARMKADRERLSRLR